MSFECNQLLPEARRHFRFGAGAFSNSSKAISTEQRRVQRPLSETHRATCQSHGRLSFCTELLLCDEHIRATLWYAKQFLGGKSIDNRSHLVLHNVQITHTHLHTHASAHVFHDNFPSICANCAGTVCHRQGLSFSHM